MNELQTLWQTVAALLRQAADTLHGGRPPAQPAVPAGPLTGTWAEFEEFLAHNELELAWETLAALAESSHASAPVWFQLAEAGKLMGSREGVDRAVRRLAEALPTEPTADVFVYQVHRRDNVGRFSAAVPASVA